MPAYLFIHPTLSALAVVLILLAYGLKAGGRKRQMAHYLAGAGALTLLLIAIGVALWAVSRRYAETGSVDPFPPIIQIHFLMAFVVAGLLLGQAGLGTAMRLNPANIAALRAYHGTIGVTLVIAATAQAGLGLLTLYGLLQNTVPTVLLVAGLLVVLGVLAAVDAVLIIRDSRAFSSQIAARENGHVVLANGNGTRARVRYTPDSLEVETSTGASILQTSLQAGIPHTHVCGGNARCSTCRVLVLDGYQNLAPRNPNERRLADRLQFDPAIRLACQTRFTGDIRVRRLVLDDDDIATTSQIRRGVRPGPVGEEKELGILFSDIRGFTSFAEGLLPYDVIHALNRYFQHMGRCIAAQGGQINNYMGDGLMALFGLENDEEDVALQAVRAGLAMVDALEEIRPYFRETYASMIDIGIGVHVGTVVVGNLGAPESKRLTAIGDAVNLASRIESANKGAGTRFLISQDTYARVADRVRVGKEVSVQLKGKTGDYTLYEVLGLREEVTERP